VSRRDLTRLLELGTLATGTDPVKLAALMDGAGAAAILSRGSERAAAEAGTTLHGARRAMRMAYDVLTPS
jgi:hypothetical protein